MLVSAKEMLNKAKAGHYAVGQFNINNLEWTKSILLAAEETRSPVILGVLMPFQFFIWLTVTPYLRAMVDRVSPLRIL